VGVPIAIFVVCLIAGVFASTRWLPELGRGPVGGLALFVVCGLFGASLADAGLRIYLTVKSAELGLGSGSLSHSFRATEVADGLSSMLFEAGSLAALAMLVYLLAPSAKPVVDPESD
jgi:hypothetical protein